MKNIKTSFPLLTLFAFGACQVSDQDGVTGGNTAAFRGEPRLVAYNRVESGENGIENLSFTLPSGFNILNSTFRTKHSFRFLHTGFSPTNQSLTLNQTVSVPGAGGELIFYSMLGLTEGGEAAVVQISTNGGNSWSDIYRQTGFGNVGETSLQRRVVNLNSFAGQNIRIRFLYAYNGGSWFWQDWLGVNGQSSGWFVDRIGVKFNGVATELEAAENGLGGVTLDVPAGYNIFNTRFAAETEEYTFRFLHSSFSPTNQIIQLRGTLVPSEASEITFRSMLGLSDSGEAAHVQVSDDEGRTWNEVYYQTGFGNVGETTFSVRRVDLSEYAGRPINIRFEYSYNGTGGWFWQDWENVNGQHSGWYIDDIAVTNAQEMVWN